MTRVKRCSTGLARCLRCLTPAACTVMCGLSFGHCWRHGRRPARALAAVSGEITTNAELRQAWHKGLAGMLTRCMRVIVTRAAGRGELPGGSDLELLAQLPLSLLLQNWRLEQDEEPGEAVAERIVRQFYTPHPSR